MNRSTILTVLGAIGVVGTAIAAAKAAPKVIYLLETAEEEKGEELTLMEKVVVATPSCIPAVALGAATIGCILGANILNKRNQAALTSAYMLLDRSYEEYKRKADELYGDNATQIISEAIAKEHEERDSDLPDEDETCLFWDYTTCRYFRDKLKNVVQKIELEDGMECYILSSPFDSPQNYYIY